MSYYKALDARPPRLIPVEVSRNLGNGSFILPFDDIEPGDILLTREEKYPFPQLSLDSRGDVRAVYCQFYVSMIREAPGICHGHVLVDTKELKIDG